MVHPTKFLASVGLDQARPNYWRLQICINDLLDYEITKVTQGYMPSIQDYSFIAVSPVIISVHI